MSSLASWGLLGTSHSMKPAGLGLLSYSTGFGVIALLALLTERSSGP